MKHQEPNDVMLIVVWKDRKSPFNRSAVSWKDFKATYATSPQEIRDVWNVVLGKSEEATVSVGTVRKPRT